MQVADRSDIELVVVKGVTPVGRARNDGLKRATGEYIAWVDADDEVEEDWLREILRATESCPDVVVLGHVWMRDEHAGVVRVWQGGDLLAAVLSQRAVRGGVCSELWSLVTRRELWRGVGFDDEARTMEDWDVAPRLLTNAKTVECIGKPLYRYFARKDSLTHLADESMMRESFNRAVARIREIRRMGLWGKYGRIATCGVGYAVYCCAETVALSGNTKSSAMRSSVRWIRRHLLSLLFSPARAACKAKWILAAMEAWWVVRWHYGRVCLRKV